MSESIEQKMNYLKETKELIRQAINSIDGNLTEESTLSTYPDEIERIIGETIIPQSVLDELVKKTIVINNEEV